MEEVLKILNPMTSTVFWTIIVFIILVVVLWRFVLKPVNRMIVKRQDEIQESINSAEKQKNEALKYLEEQKQQLEDTKAESQRIIEESKTAAMKTSQEIERKADEKSRALMESTMQELKLERERSVVAVKDQIVDIAVKLSEKVIKKSLSGKEHKKIIGESLGELEKMN